MDDCAEILMSQILEMEIQYHVAKTQLASLEYQTTRSKLSAEVSREPGEEEYTKTQTRPTRDYAEAPKCLS